MATKRLYKLSSKIMVYPGFGAWRFIHVGKKESAEIRKNFGAHAAGFGSIKVEVTIGKTIWHTSIFPDKKSGTYLLPLKALVRKYEAIDDEDTVSFTIKIR
jgi:hypothetical protein